MVVHKVKLRKKKGRKDFSRDQAAENRGNVYTAALHGRIDIETGSTV